MADLGDTLQLDHATFPSRILPVIQHLYVGRRPHVSTPLCISHFGGSLIHRCFLQASSGFQELCDVGRLASYQWRFRSYCRSSVHVVYDDVLYQSCK
jgi:hypothetical protein